MIAGFTNLTFLAAIPLGDIWNQMSADDVVTAILLLLLQLFVILLVLIGGGYATYFLFSLPQRRLERAMIFLQLVETGLKQGVSPEDTIKSVAQCRDVSVSVRFHLLAAYIEQGATWREALGLVPRLLPPSVQQMLLLTDQLGGWERVMPLCRRQLEDIRSQLQARQSFLSPSAIFLPLPIIFVWFMLSVVVLPKFRVIAVDMGVPLELSFIWFHNHSFFLCLLLFVLALFPIVILFTHVGGPRINGWLARFSFPLGDYIDWHFPWRKLRVQRDFAALLGLLLDAGVAEKDAVALAAKGTANTRCTKQANAVLSDLNQGVDLTRALARMDDSGEFRWRFEQAALSEGKFENALRGWCDALTGRAYQWQQTLTHIFSVFMLLMNALLVTLIAWGVFQALIQLIEMAGSE